jgi:tetratricopeptide (TPR) repeat protein
MRWEKLPGVSVSHFEDGSSRGVKYARDIALLERAVEESPDDPRTIYYLAQSYRDSGNLQRAVEWYERRAGMSGWEEERWHARYQAARLQHRIGVAWPLVLGLYLNAYEERPTRAEPLYWIARAYRESGQPRTALLFAEAGLRLPYPDDQLFIEREVYEGGLESERIACVSSLGGVGADPTKHPD